MILCLKRVLFRFCLAACCLRPQVLTGCAGTMAVVPPVNVETLQTYHIGKFVWFDLFTTEIKQAASFYEHLFGWTLTPVSTLGQRDLLTIYSKFSFP
ncbi:hypothetical protein DO021_21790 [Desulfobacter hydrogenophilus]|uniref:VOC domain-containing protein n=1 Tax=Desulfobacter hydrogenophilus TaxID=2291 RepID=A0A328F6E8_9BACT|nr:hypothetical protein DO021_21790 [Desulfobacter hydrogenophilus]